MPILHSGLETDLRLALALDQALRVTLTDTHSMRTSGAISFLGTVNGTGSDTSQIRFAGLHTDPFVATGESTDVAETALADASTSIAVVRAALVRQVSDLAVATGFSQDINAPVLASSMVQSYDKYFNSLIGTAIATAGTDVGSSGIDMSVSDFHDAIYTLQIAEVPGPWHCMLHARQLSDLQESARGEAGATQYQAATAELLNIKGQGYAGTLLGVDIWRSSGVSGDGTNRHGGMWGLGALGFKTAIVSPTIGAGSAFMVRMDELLVELARRPGEALEEVVGNAYVGVGLIEDARIVGIVTDQ